MGRDFGENNAYGRFEVRMAKSRETSCKELADLEECIERSYRMRMAPLTIGTLVHQTLSWGMVVRSSAQIFVPTEDEHS